ncbi:MAG: uracil-DNA glycosylase [Anaerolineae bacterium]|nr:uracil-DNA glycosylase [Anaerolineae bacterium]
MNKHVVPVLVQGARMPTPHELPEDLIPLARRQAVSLSHKGFAYDVEKLAAQLRQLIQPAPRQRSTPEVLSAKAEALKQLRLELLNFKDSPLYAHRVAMGYLPALGDGNPDAQIIFIGEAPGKTEVEQGLTFIGASGEVLDEMLRSINLDRRDVFLTNVLHDRPPDNRDPLPAELAAYQPFMDRLLEIIQPSVIATLGRFAMSYILRKYDLPEKRESISKLHGKLLRAHAPYGEIYILPLYHPAFVLYNATQKSVLLKDFQKLKLFV